MSRASRIAAPAIMNAARLWALAALGAIALSLVVAGAGGELVNANGLPQFWSFFAAAVRPDLSPDFLQTVGRATLTTFAYAVCGTVLSVMIGAIGGVLASEVWWSAVFPHQKRPIWVGIRAGLAVPRAIHELIWGLFLVNIIGLDPLVGILAIVIPYSAIVSKIFAEILDETPRQPLLALLNSGVSPFVAFTYSLIPQAFLNLVSYSFYRFECSLRSAAVLGIIGAGGLGYEILLSLQSLRYSQLWTLFYALVLLNGAVDIASTRLRQSLGAPTRLDLNSLKTTRKSSHFDVSRSDRPTVFPLLLFCCLAVAIVLLSFVYINADFSRLWSVRTQQLLLDIAQSTFPPNLSNDLLRQILPLSLQTIAMSILAIALAGVGGVLLSFPAANNMFLPGGLLNAGKSTPIARLFAWIGLLLTRSLLLFFRSIPAPIWALVAVFVLFPGILPGAIALGIHNMGILGRLMAEVIENLDQRPLMALRAQGTPAALVFLYGIVPLTLNRFLAYILYRWEVCMRETVIVGLVGAGGLGRLLTEQLSSFDYRSLVVTLGCFVVLTFLVDWISGIVRRSLR